MNDTQISAKHWEKAMLHANWDMEDEMKISNAIRNVERIFSNSPDIVSDEAIESVEIALEAMQKQDPTKPTYDHRYAELGCAFCGNLVSGWEELPNYCPQCGQAIDWSEE